MIGTWKEPLIIFTISHHQGQQLTFANLMNFIYVIKVSESHNLVEMVFNSFLYLELWVYDYHTRFFADSFSDVILAEGISTFCDDLQVLFIDKCGNFLFYDLFMPAFCQLSTLLQHCTSMTATALNFWISPTVIGRLTWYPQSFHVIV